MEEKCGKGEIMIRKKRDLSPDAKLRFPDYLGYFSGQEPILPDILYPLFADLLF